MAKKSSLGIGLAELLSSTKVTESTVAMRGKELQEIPLDLLKPGKYQPRRTMQNENLAELAESIRQHGVVQPLVIRQIAPQQYEIIAGERRWRAAQLAGLQQVPVILKEFSDQQAMAISLIENLQREDLNVLDTALGVQRLIDEFAMTHEQAATIIGKSRVAVTNLLRLLTLPAALQDLLKNGELEMGHARALIGLNLEQQLALAHQVTTQHLSVRACEALVRKMQQQQQVTKIKPKADPNLLALERDLAESLAADVKLVPLSKGHGRIVINYHSLDELTEILKHLNHK